MPGLSFQPWKAAKVESGVCRCTIRQQRKRPIKVGDRLYHWQQQRTPQRRKLGEAICTATRQIRIDQAQVWLDGSQAALSFDQLLELATKDGFGSVEEFFLFFLKQYTYPFEGVLIEWDELIKPLAEPAAIAPGRVQLPIVEVV